MNIKLITIDKYTYFLNNWKEFCWNIVCCCIICCCCISCCYRSGKSEEIYIIFQEKNANNPEFKKKSENNLEFKKSEQKVNLLWTFCELNFRLFALFFLNFRLFALFLSLNSKLFFLFLRKMENIQSSKISCWTLRYFSVKNSSKSG